MKALIDVLPREFRIEYTDSLAWTLRDILVASEHDGTIERWPGKHRNVYVWWTLKNGKRVGWNENPARGWSFPVL